MSGGPKGRQLKPLKEKVGRLAAKAETRDSANRLRNYMEMLLLAMQLRPEKIASVPRSELQAILQKLAPMRLKLPLEVRLALVDHRAADLVAKSAFEELAEVLKPWAADGDTNEFKPEEPLLRALHVMPTTSRIARFKKDFWGTAITPLVMSAAADDMPRVVKACQVVERLFGSEDTLNLETAAALLMTECLTSARAVRALATKSIGAEAHDDIEALLARQGDSDKSILTSTACAAVGNPILKETLAVFEKSRATLLEFGDKLSEHAKTLQTGVRPDLEGFKRLSLMLADLAKVRSSPACGLFDDFAALLLKQSLATWASFSKACNAGDVQVTSELIGAVDAFAAEASIAYSLEDDVAEMRAAVTALQVRANDEAHMRALDDALQGDDSLPELEDAQFVAKVAEIMDLLAKHEGKRLASTTETSVVEFTERLVKGLMDGLCEVKLSYAVLHGLDLWNKLLSFKSTDAAPRKMFNLAVAVQKLAGQLHVALDAPPGETLNSAVHAVGVLRVRAEYDLRVCGEVKEEQKLFFACITHANETISASMDLQVQHSATVVADAVGEVSMQLQVCAALCEGLESREPSKTWYAGIDGPSQAAWGKLVQRAEEGVFKVDTKALEANLKTLKDKHDGLRSALDLCPGAAADDRKLLEDSWVAYVDMQVFLRTVLLTWVLSKESDHEAQRKRVQQEVRFLRSVSVKEREVMPECLYKRSCDALACRTT